MRIEQKWVGDRCRRTLVGSGRVRKEEKKGVGRKGGIRIKELVDLPLPLLIQGTCRPLLISSSFSLLCQPPVSFGYRGPSSIIMATSVEAVSVYSPALILAAHHDTDQNKGGNLFSLSGNTCPFWTLRSIYFCLFASSSCALCAPRPTEKH
jgi:hypothetical protein